MTLSKGWGRRSGAVVRRSRTLIDGLMEVVWVRNDTINLINEHGMSEYFDPSDGDGLGGMDFSWTAAVYLDLNRAIVAASIAAAE